MLDNSYNHKIASYGGWSFIRIIIPNNHLDNQLYALLHECDPMWEMQACDVHKELPYMISLSFMIFNSCFELIKFSMNIVFAAGWNTNIHEQVVSVSVQ